MHPGHVDPAQQACRQFEAELVEHGVPSASHLNRYVHMADGQAVFVFEQVSVIECSEKVARHICTVMYHIQ